MTAVAFVVDRVDINVMHPCMHASVAVDTVVKMVGGVNANKELQVAWFWNVIEFVVVLQ